MSEENFPAFKPRLKPGQFLVGLAGQYTLAYLSTLPTIKMSAAMCMVSRWASQACRGVTLVTHPTIGMMIWFMPPTKAILEVTLAVFQHIEPKSLWKQNVKKQ